MNTKQEIVDAMNGEHEGPAPPALFTQTGTVEMMESCGAYWPEANFNIDAMVRLALQPSELYGFSTARIPFDITAEAERLGCEIFEGDSKRQPMVTGSPWRTGEVLDPPDLMPVDEFLSGGRVRLHIDAAERISREHPELFLTSCIIDPTGVASHMVGMENMIMALFLAPDAVLKWSEKLTPYQCAYAEALSEHSDNIMMISGGSEDISPPDTFDTFTRPFNSKVFSSIRESFSLAHSCGHTDSVLEKLASLGETALSVESHGDPARIVEHVGETVIVAGGVSPVSTLMLGTPEEVVGSAWKSSDSGYDVIMSECGVPPQTPGTNLRALAEYRGRQHN